MYRIDIIGTLHIATPRFNAMDLYSFLLALEPQAILEERERDAGGGKPPVREGSIEDEAISAYEKGRSLLRLPYEMDGWARESREAAFLEAEKKFFDLLKRMADSGRLSQSVIGALAAAEGAKRIYDELFSMTMKDLNAPSVPARLEAMEAARLSIAEGACGAYPELAAHRESLLKIKRLQERRRAARAENVLTALARHRPEKAVLVCGIAEKGRMQRAVAAQAARTGYIVGDFWEGR